MKYEVTSPTGQKFEITAPEGATQDQVLAYAQQQFSQPAPKAEPAAPEYGAMRNIGMGALKGSVDIGRTLLAPVDYLKDLISPPTGPSSREQRKQFFEKFFKENADPTSLAFQGGALGAQVAGTAGVPGALAKGASAIPALAKFAPLLASGGMELGGAATGSAAANLALRGGAGALTGAAQTGLIDPSQAGLGAAIGGVIPGAVTGAGMLGKKLAPKVSPEVAALFKKAQSLGIDVPADRLVNSRPLNAVAASLNYVPLSGRMAVEDKMLSQLNKAVARTMGQESSNIPKALTQARKELGNAFDNVLQSTPVKVDQQLLDDLVNAQQIAGAELVPEQAKIINGQIENILGKAADGIIDGQAAYNIKRTLDRIAKRNTPEAHYAGELRNKLVDALNRSLGPEDAAAFAKVRQQYGNMMEIRKLAPNGAEGEITAGRLANLRNIKNRDLQDVADIAAQFARTRENPHGAAQRIAMGILGAGGSIANPVAAGAAMGAGRLANNVLASPKTANFLMNPLQQDLAYNPLSRALIMSTLANQGILQ